jgi:hypothetical protein
MNTNLFDLNNDILEIIGNYVKKDNHDKMINKRFKQTLKEQPFDYIDNEIKQKEKKEKK